MATKTWMKNSAGIRIIIIAVLTLVMLIPALMVQSLIEERQMRRDSAVLEVNERWGREQTIMGPVITVPYLKYYRNDNKELVSVVQYAHFLPNNFVANGKMIPEIRHRGIYEIVLYSSTLEISGYFNLPDFSSFNIDDKDILWDDAFLSLGINDMAGIKELIEIKWNEQLFQGNPGIKTNEVLKSGISSAISFDRKQDKYNFNINLKLNGSQLLFFTPVAENNRVTITANWTNPSFQGRFLPEEHNIDKKSFTAKWRVLHLNRNYPQQWLGNKYNMYNSTFGVELLLPVDDYQKNMRTAKYAIMFISLTFITFFMMELLNKKSIHPVQYILIGFALLIFYTLLLSFSEHISFGLSYLIAASSIIILITLYTRGVLKDKMLSMIVAAILILLYGYLYTILQLQDFALLMGSIGLFVVLSVVMFLTRKIDWYSAFGNNNGVKK